jgi:hypothetical protein
MLCVRRAAFAEFSRRLEMPYPPAVGLASPEELAWALP